VVSSATSTPEPAVTLDAALTGEPAIAVGNVGGSNIFNLGAVLGLAAVISPGGVPVESGAVRFDLPVMTAVAGHDAFAPFSRVMLAFVVPLTLLTLAVLVVGEVRRRRTPARVGGSDP
jgi:cation:H+ antiporter